MAKQIVNVGATPNDRDADSIRVAFSKINQNFTELYTALGLNADGTLNLGAFEFTGSTISTTDSSSITIDQATTVSSNLTVGGDLLPTVVQGGDLGSPARPWRSLYVSSSTIYFGSVPVTVDDSGNLLVGGAAVADVGTAAWDNVTGKPTFAAVATSGSYADLSNLPAVPADINDLTDTGNLLFDGDYGSLTNQPVIPADIGDLTDTGNLLGGDTGNWTFSSNTLSENSTGNAVIQSSDFAGSKLILQTRGPTDKQWIFDQDGDLTFPDATVQTTAYPGPQNTLDGDSISIGRVDAGEVDIYGDVEFNNGVTAFQPGNSVSFNGPVNFASATVTGLSIAPQTTLDGDVTGSVFSDGSTLLVDGVSGKIVGDVETARLRTSATEIALGNDAGTTGQGGFSVAIGTATGSTDQGSFSVALGTNAGQTNQSAFDIAIGANAGQNDQGSFSIAIGSNAGQISQASYAVALGTNAGLDSQGMNTVAIGVNAGQDSQGSFGIAIGVNAGQLNQGADAIAIGRNAASSNQAANSIVINATTSSVQNTTANTFVVKPVRAAAGTSILQYDASTGEISHTNDIYSDQQISITVSGEDSTSKTWYFGNDGDLLLPGRLLLNSGGVQETFQPKVDATGVVDHDCSLGQIFYHTSPDANWTANFTNLDLGTSASTNLVLVVEQGATPYYPSAVQIGGAAQTIKWLGNVTPTPAANKTEIATFTIFNNAGTFTVLGSYSTYG